MTKIVRRGFARAFVAALAAAPLAAQPRPEVTPGIRPFVTVDAPVVALAHVRVMDGTGAPARDDQTVIVRAWTCAATR